MGRHLFFLLLAKSKVVREVRELGQNRPMVQLDTTPTQSYAESWPVPGGAKIKGGKNKEGERGASFALTPTPPPRFFSSSIILRRVNDLNACSRLAES